MIPRIPKSNLHTHTCFCDGKNTPEEMVLAAISAGMEVLGFSGHAYTPFDLTYCMTPEKTVQYRQEVLRLKEKYKDRIVILLGIEQDYYAEPPTEPYDYIIGAVHYVLLDGEYCAVDDSPERIRKAVREHCGGDIYRFLRAYYETLSQVVEKTGCQIVAHPDLTVKFNEDGALFNEDDLRYRRYSLNAIDTLLAKENLIIEMNTGAVARGYRKIPYPSPFLLRRIGWASGRLILSSDAHCREQLMYGFPEAVCLAHSCGVGSLQVMTRYGWKTVQI